MNTFLAIINSPVIQVAFLIVSAYILTWIVNKKPQYVKYMGYIISSIKFAEKVIPDESPVPGLHKMDDAMKQFIVIYERYEGSKPPPSLIKEVSAHMGEVHDELEAKGTLKSCKVENNIGV